MRAYISGIDVLHQVQEGLLRLRFLTPAAMAWRDGNLDGFDRAGAHNDVLVPLLAGSTFIELMRAEGLRCIRCVPPDVTYRDEGTVFLFWFCTPKAQEWASAKFAQPVTEFADVVAVEHRYARPLLEGLERDGLRILERDVDDHRALGREGAHCCPACGHEYDEPVTRPHCPACVEHEDVAGR